MQLLISAGKVKRANRFTIGDRADLSVENVIESSEKKSFLVTKSLGGKFVVTEVGSVEVHEQVVEKEKVAPKSQEAVVKKEKKDGQGKSKRKSAKGVKGIRDGGNEKGRR